MFALACSPALAPEPARSAEPALVVEPASKNDLPSAAAPAPERARDEAEEDVDGLELYLGPDELPRYELFAVLAGADGGGARAHRGARRVARAAAEEPLIDIAEDEQGRRALELQLDRSHDPAYFERAMSTLRETFGAELRADCIPRRWLRYAE